MPQVTKLGVIGLGYIGLPTATIFAARGLNVLGVDVRSSVVDSVNRGKAHIFEPGLDELAQSCVKEGHLRASLTAEPCDCFIIAVPTPLRADNIPDISYIDAAVNSLAPVIKAGDSIILESTSPVGTTERVSEKLAQARPDLRLPTGSKDAPHNVHVSHCPERVLPGNILHELVHNERVVGGIEPCCTETALSLYQEVVQGQCFATTARTAEMVKLSENAYRDTNIAFANELSLIAGKHGIDVHELIGLANRHPRVNILKPGAGVGGHCIAVDPWFIVHSAPQEAQLIRTARLVNEAKAVWVANQAIELAKKHPDHRIGCLGLTFKPDVDDLRESPSVMIIERLINAKIGPIMVHDPFVDTLPESLAKPGVELNDLNTVLKTADILILLTDHSIYRNIPQSRWSEKLVLDPAGAWKQASLAHSTSPQGREKKH